MKSRHKRNIEIGLNQLNQKEEIEEKKSMLFFYEPKKPECLTQKNNKQNK